MIPSPQLLEPFHRAKNHGEGWWWLGSLAIIKATGAETGGRFSLIELVEPPNLEAPLHLHHREDEGFLILEGEATFYIGDRVIKAGPGDFVFGPKDIPHRYDVGANGIRMYYLFAPAGVEACIREMSTPARSLTLPPADEPMPDLDTLKRIAGKYGVEMLF